MILLLLLLLAIGVMDSRKGREPEEEYKKRGAELIIISNFADDETLCFFQLHQHPSHSESSQ